MQNLIALVTGLVLTITPAPSPVSHSQNCNPSNSCTVINFYSPDHRTISSYSNDYLALEDSTSTPSSSLATQPQTTPEPKTTSEITIQNQHIDIATVPLPTPSSEVKTGLDPEVIFTLINQYRQNHNLPPFQKEDQLCQLAQSRAPELHQEIFEGKGMHAGFKARNLTYWITENMIHQPNEEAAVAWWLRSPIHRRAIESNHTFSCGACNGNSCAQLFTSYQPKG